MKHVSRTDVEGKDARRGFRKKRRPPRLSAGYKQSRLAFDKCQGVGNETKEGITSLSLRTNPDFRLSVVTNNNNNTHIRHINTSHSGKILHT